MSGNAEKEGDGVAGATATAVTSAAEGPHLALPHLAQSMMKTNSAMILSMQRMCDALEAQNRLLRRALKADKTEAAEAACEEGSELSAKKRKGRPPSSSTWKEYLKRYPSPGSIEHYSSLTQSEKNSIRIGAKKHFRDDDEGSPKKQRKPRRESDVVE
mmetsp:Transcript_9138/g.29041  ORF Transcript_9138/g.29041 Transcript_9138/m.29041 type:complete len:158 (+) Transcript_9138:196-669(+)